MKKIYSYPEIEVRLFSAGDNVRAADPVGGDAVLLSGGYTAGQDIQAQMYPTINRNSAYVATVKVMNVIKFNE